MVGRLMVWQVSVVLAVLAALGFVIDRALERNLVDGLTDSLARQGEQARATLSTGSGDLQQETIRLGRAAGARFTIIREDGVVLADSEHDPATMENHGTRPEVVQALDGEVGVASRRSATVGVEFLYVALPPEDGTIVRVALPLTRVREQQRDLRLPLALGLLAAAGATTAGVLMVNRGVVRPLRRMAERLGRLSEGDLSARVEASGTEELAALSSTLNRMAARLSDEIRSAREEQETRDLILSSMEEGVLFTGREGDVVFANAALERHLGGRPDRIADLFPPDLREALSTATREGQPVGFEVELSRPARWIRGSAVPVGSDGSALLVVRDVTRARQVEAVRRDFVTNASHELKTPAASIQATAEAIRLAADEDPEAVPRFARQLEREAVRLSRIVADLLDLSRLESGSALGEAVELSTVVREEAERFRDRAEEAGVELSVEAPGRAFVRGSRRDLGLLVRNLVDNAIRYTRPGGRVEVRLDAEDGQAVVRVRDTGIGIPIRDLPRVFERFFRVDRGRSRDTGGTGLGLSIVKHVAENHGGSARATSELGRGSEFEVRLPARDSA
jgi:two-component system phosphate regulon sensor histidine kinase PhoR